MKKIVKEGTFLYDNEVVCHVQIIKTDVRRGSGDPFDPKEIRENKKGTFYYIKYINPFGSGGATFCYDLLEEAIKGAEKATKIKWEK